ncbi:MULTISPECIES: WG repeat-containing protein [Paenibacillus]|uniref:KWG Leptospira repeat protein n=2 Tax=Paenibacillus lactis TaxID=228574 RepID=G4HK00_9BACL|nr:WG repeat-containing protein [Paenibacillus lactis]EHB62384.1 KWG Leptospira repeat protein [Paenibacillus lactis 154]MBP1894039.1 hypothetical protein [Paenibacillus lactis]GIO90161.1 hypothetical protein J31TS3_13880 [Paenibacillus lactis]
MTVNDQQLAQIAKAYLPHGAELVTIGKPMEHAAVIAADITGDRIPEIAGVYRWNDELYLFVLQYRNGGYEVMANIMGQGYAVTLLGAVPVMAPGKNQIIVGWQVGSIWSKLSIYDWTSEGLKDIAPPEMSYSYIDVLDIPGGSGPDGQAEIVLWIHDTGEAYRVEVVRWSQGRFVTAPDVYPHYFPVVVRYYERLTQKHPDYSFYWYYLADAQYRAGMPEAALASVRMALRFPEPYPMRETLLELESRIKQMLAGRWEPRQPVGLFPASVKTTSGTKWGYIDRSGKLIIQPKYEDAQDFQDNGLAIVGMHGNYGLIDRSERYVVAPIYQSISPFSEHRAIVIDHQGFKMIDEQGNVLTRRAYPYISVLKEGRAVYYVTDQGSGNGAASRYGYLDAEGREVIPAQFEEANDFADGKAVVKIKDNHYALIDPHGRRLADYPFAYVGPLGDGLLAFQQDPNGKYGYINEQGNIVISPTYTSAFPFHQGRAIVNTAEDYRWKYGVIDSQGKWIIQPEYNDIRDLNEERFALGRAVDPEQPYIGSIYAIADWEGKRLSEFMYRDVSDYQHGLASVYDGKQTYFIDRTGHPAPGYPRVDGSGSLTLEPGGLIKALVDQRLSYLDRSGHVIWRQNTVIPLNPPYQVIEEKYKPNPDYLVYYPQLAGMRDQAAQQTLNTKLKEMSQVKYIPPNQQLDYSYTGDFDVIFYKHQLLELELTGYNYPFGAAHGMPSKVFAAINLDNGRIYELKDLFKAGSDYVKELSRIVGKQIQEDPQYSYVFPDSYKGIAPNQPFNVTEDALHLVFAPYEIAPYAAGFPTFTIPFTQIMNIINTEGEFWRAFHS